MTHKNIKTLKKSNTDLESATKHTLQQHIQTLYDHAEYMAKELTLSIDDHMVNMVTIRDEWSKSEIKHIAKIKDLKHELNKTKDQAEYWENTWRELAEDNLRDEHAEQKNTIALQAKIIYLLGH